MIKFDLHKTFKSKKDVQISLNAEWETGKIIAIYGASGAGKSTLLRMLAGLVTPDKGQLSVEGEDWYNSSTKTNLKVNKRNIGYLFQDYALFPNMTVLQNIKFGMDNKDDEELIQGIIDIADLDELLDRKPETLSGGQQQRVALARAIARRPKLLLLDEPLSALDTHMRAKLQKEILSVNQVIDATIVLVSHDLPEVIKLADEVLLIENGIFTKRGKPSEIFAQVQADTKGDVLSTETRDGKKVLKVMVDGRLVEVEVPNN